MRMNSMRTLTAARRSMLASIFVCMVAIVPVGEPVSAATGAAGSASYRPASKSPGAVRYSQACGVDSCSRGQFSCCEVLRSPNFDPPERPSFERPKGGSGKAAKKKKQDRKSGAGGRNNRDGGRNGSGNRDGNRR